MAEELTELQRRETVAAAQHLRQQAGVLAERAERGAEKLDRARGELEAAKEAHTTAVDDAKAADHAANEAEKAAAGLDLELTGGEDVPAQADVAEGTGKARG